MATQKQLAANRLNARRSTGPRSAEGKARSSLNALKTGIHAKSQVIHDESPWALDALTKEYYDRFHPTTPEQRTLVDTLIDAEWLLRRFRCVEAQLWNQGSPNVEVGIYDINLAVAFRDTCDEFSRLQRRIDTTHRNYRNALHELERLQAEEEAALQPDPDPEPTLVTPHNKTPNPENGFVPQLLPDTLAALPSPPSEPAPNPLLR